MPTALRGHVRHVRIGRELTPCNAQFGRMGISRTHVFMDGGLCHTCPRKAVGMAPTLEFHERIFA